MDTGEVIFFGQLTWPGRRIVASMVDNIDYPFAGVMAFMVFVLAMISTLIYSSPIPASADVIAIPDRFAEVVLSQPEPEPVRPPTASPSDEPDPLDEGAVAKDEEGKVGKTDAKMKMAKGKKVEIQKQELDREVATEAGVLGVIGDNSALSGVFGSASISADLVSGVGGLLGSKGNQQGTNGLGSRGTGLGEAALQTRSAVWEPEVVAAVTRAMAISQQPVPAQKGTSAESAGPRSLSVPWIALSSTRSSSAT
jgi:hypothetical protein